MLKICQKINKLLKITSKLFIEEYVAQKLMTISTRRIKQSQNNCRSDYDKMEKITAVTDDLSIKCRKKKKKE